MQIKSGYVFFAMFTSLLAGGFYWYEYRPAMVRQECSTFVIERLLRLADSDEPARWIENWTAICVSAGGPEPFVKSIKAGDAEAAKRNSTAGSAYATQPKR